MRILHIVQRYWPAIGGAETHMQEISARLAAEGHAVTILTTDALDFDLFWDPRRRRVAQAHESHQGVRILRFPVRHLPLAPLAYSGWRRLLWLLSAAQPVPTAWLANLARFTPWVPGLWRWLDTTPESFDLVAGMTICYEPLLAAGLRFARARGLPFVVYPLTHLGAGKAPGEDALGRFYTMRHQVDIVLRSDALAAQTATEAAFYRQRGLGAERIRVIGCGVNPAPLWGGSAARFRAAHHITSPIVFSIGTMTYDKGTPHTLEAMRLLWRRGYSATLALAGNVPQPFAQQVRRLSAEERGRILLLGRISEEEKRDLLAAGSLLAMPSRTDSFGIAYLEAWLYARPVIGARTWGIGDLIQDGANGLLVPFGDVRALAAAIARLLDRPEEAASLGAAGQAMVLGAYTWEQRYALVRELYQQLVMRGNRP